MLKKAMERLTKEEVMRAQSLMQELAKAGFKPGKIKAKATASFTKAMSAQCLRALARMKGEQITVANVESYDPRTQRSSDFLGMIDLLAITPTKTRGIQACGTDVMAHFHKIGEGDRERKLRLWMASGDRTFEIWSWRHERILKKNGTRGAKKFWFPRVQIVDLYYLDNIKEGDGVKARMLDLSE